ncbi:PH domain-containing protein [Halorientalis salina]|uniref:PH domain-containing protein n=1 Tax=Halorientalis salina TaxID=2932266 RepID=UPI0010ABE873|nr:PH domain-containing protein [Halorientalis salina]
MNALHPRVRLRWGLLALVALAVIGGLVTVVDRFLLGISPLLGVGLALVLIPLVVLYVLALYRRWRYELQSDALELERGVVTQVETAVPYVRVQHVDTQRDPLDRVLGLGSVVVYTAGSRGADVSIPGLTAEDARELRNRLRDLAIESEPEDAV